ncbi:MAG: hypothetical protein OSJ61_21975 [Lachnospiraceae bacterium]|nr:hypothetical protein [Lachnospiraceae bacterium]
MIRVRKGGADTGIYFVLDGEQYQKCRYMAFQPTLSEENNPYIKQFLEKELQAEKSD